MDAYAPIAMAQQASRAYGVANSFGTVGQTSGIGAESIAPTGGFGDMVSDAAESAMQSLRQSERITAQGVAGKADVQAVVEAASNAEMTVKTTVAILGKAMSAYNDVLKMAV